jgi:SAM-dependent MidA family methyltransferase
MEAALYDAQEGYYCRSDRQRWGRQGDYRTAPERSVLFAAAFAHYSKALYQELNSPGAWTIVEAGAGAGDFAAAFLSALNRENPQILSATHYIIDERSADSRSHAANRLASFRDQIEFKSIRDIGLIEKGVIITNELLDALPVHRVTVKRGQLAEFYVSLDKHGSFTWATGPPSTARLADYFAELGLMVRENHIAEVNLEAKDWITQSAEKLRQGYLITVDYGAEAAELYQSVMHPNGTLRAFKRHQIVDNLLSGPGEQDLTSTLDWTTLRQVVENVGFKTLEFERLDRFLLPAGLLEILELLVQHAVSESERVRLRTEAREMILPHGLAASFQVLVQRRIS